MRSTRTILGRWILSAHVLPARIIVVHADTKPSAHSIAGATRIIIVHQIGMVTSKAALVTDILSVFSTVDILGLCQLLSKVHSLSSRAHLRARHLHVFSFDTIPKVDQQGIIYNSTSRLMPY